MREAVFRAWDTTRNIYGQVLKLEYPYSPTDTNFAGHPGRLSLYNPKNERDCGFWGLWLDKAVLEQFTGAKDKSGKKIWEGDIVVFRHPDELDEDNPYNGKPLIVEYDENSAQFVLNHAIDGIQDSFIWFWGDKIMDGGPYEYLEVVGNIHENPDLLAGGER